MHLTQTSIAQIIHRDVGLKCFFRFQNARLLLLLVYLTFIFHKVAWRHTNGVVGCITITLLHIVQGVCKQKNFEDMDKSYVARCGPQCKLIIWMTQTNVPWFLRGSSKPPPTSWGGGLGERGKLPHSAASSLVQTPDAWIFSALRTASPETIAWLIEAHKTCILMLMHFGDKRNGDINRWLPLAGYNSDFWQMPAYWDWAGRWQPGSWL